MMAESRNNLTRQKVHAGQRPVAPELTQFIQQRRIDHCWATVQ
jgi:hypothetical protein